MLVRNDIEIDYETLFAKYNYGLIAWSPLAGGFLTGKYLNGIDENELTRMTDKSISFPLEVIKALFYSPHATEKTINSLKQISALAEAAGYKLLHLALAWAIKFVHLDSALIGARTVAQLEDCLRALEYLEKLTPEFEAKVNKILGTTPTARMNYLKWSPNPSIRPVEK